MSGIPGYDFGDESVPDAPISMAEFERLIVIIVSHDRWFARPSRRTTGK